METGERGTAEREGRGFGVVHVGVGGREGIQRGERRRERG
jgi:hypothetical protein